MTVFMKDLNTGDKFKFNGGKNEYYAFRRDGKVFYRNQKRRILVNWKMLLTRVIITNFNW